MSLLAPLYFAGALAIGLPILFHLIRRRPRGEVEFSSLMFLRPTPPRLTRRSRLDNWPLLLIRALALVLLAAAFARPFLRSAAKSDLDLASRRMVIALDTSASMQRVGLWEQATSKVDEILTDLRPGDQLALVSFDRQPKTLLSFDQSSRLTPEQVRSTVSTLLSETKPSWAGTDLGRAISFAADLAVSFEPDASELPDSPGTDAAAVPGPRSGGPANLILISDMQVGSKIESLQVYAWPDQLSLDIRRVVCDRKTNASAQLLTDGDESVEAKDRVRVRVFNSADADQSSFQVAWSEADGRPVEGTEMPVQVPPGESRVLRMPLPAPGVTALTLRGDDHDFDNTWYVVSPQPESLRLLHLGSETEKPRDSLFYYLQRVPLNTTRRTVTAETIPPDQLTTTPESKSVPLVVATEPFSSDVAQRLRQYVTGGGQLLFVLAESRSNGGSTACLRLLTEIDHLDVSEAEIDDYVMLSRIDFRHPVFATMADPQFNDFTKIRFWSHRTLSGLPDDWKVLARFDDEDPALLEQTVGRGKIWVLAAGWQPKASQLALSTKFIPLIFSLFDPKTSSLTETDQFWIGEDISFEPSPTAQIIRPDGTESNYKNSADLDAIDSPGIYRLVDRESSRSIAVNLDDAESRTETFGEDALERFDISLGATLTTAEELKNRRQLRDRELESRQRLWQWLLVAVLVLLALETWLGGLLTGIRTADREASLG